MKIAISTIAFRDLTIEEIIQQAKIENWAIEFSSGLSHRHDLKEVYLNADIERLPHNYFPSPKEPFVLNLASLDEQVVQKSLQHCIQGLELAKASKAPFYSAHAGFCGDPKPEELGKKIEFISGFNLEFHWTRFVECIERLLTAADALGVDFLIENNVCTNFNLTSDDQNPLLCSSPDQIKELFATINNPRLGLLLDTAHLKVSSNTLNFDLTSAIRETRKYIRLIHHSDNNGLNDTNESLPNNYWFLTHINLFKTVPHVLEVKDITVEKIRQQISLLGS
jgi:sugar phosphate isomerase/epimerase